MSDWYMISKYTNEPVRVGYMFVGKSTKIVHLTTFNDESVCGRVINGGCYATSDDALSARICVRCWKTFTKRECAQDGGPAEDAGFQETSVTVQPMPSVPDMANVPRECYFGCGEHSSYAWIDYVGRTEGVCTHHVSRLMDDGREFYPVESEVITVDVSEVIKGDMILGAEDMGHVRSARQGVDRGGYMVYGENYSDLFGYPQQIRVIRTVPYVVKGRVMITIPGLTWPESGEPVELDEGTERFIITPGYSTQRDCARMTSIKRYGKVLETVRVTDLTYVGPLN